MISRVQLLERLPDLPRWVEIRSMLLSGNAALGGEAEPLGATVVAQDGRLGGIVGQPEPQVIRAAADRLAPGELLLVAPESADAVRRALPDWADEAATIHSLADPARLPEPGPDVRFVGAESVEASALTRNTKDELLAELAAGVPVAATFENGVATSFCYAGAVTEGLWDISIDTALPFRRRGHASRCVSFLVRHYRSLGRLPVWGAAASNYPSAALAAKLGFVPCDELRLFSR